MLLIVQLTITIQRQEPLSSNLQEKEIIIVSEKTMHSMIELLGRPAVSLAVEENITHNDLLIRYEQLRDVANQLHRLLRDNKIPLVEEWIHPDPKG
jgi:hypothetical protein